MEKKGREEEDDDDDGIFDITAVQLFGMPDESFLSKETDDKKKE